MNSSYFDCPQDKAFVCDFEADPTDFQVEEQQNQEEVPNLFGEDMYGFSCKVFDSQFDEPDRNDQFNCQLGNLEEEIKMTYNEDEDGSDEDSRSLHHLTASRTCDSRTVQKSIKKRNRSKENPKRQIKKWTEDENKSLKNLFQLYKGEWEIIAKFLEGRTVSQCKQHWQRIDEGYQKKKRLWTQEEDDLIRSFTRDNDQFNNWSLIASKLKERTGKQVRERYLNQLRPEINKEQPWSEDEDKLLLSLYQQYGSKWSVINKNFEGRSEIMLKNRFKKLEKSNYVDHYLVTDDQPITCSQQSRDKQSFSFQISQQSNTLSFI